jgi:hypothetical protein
MASVVWRRRGLSGPFYRRLAGPRVPGGGGGRGRGATASTGELAMGTGMALTPIGTVRAGCGG